MSGLLSRICVGLLLCSSPALAEGVIQVRVVYKQTQLIPSDIQFRRSSIAPWETLDRADRGEAAISFACAAGVQVRADPLNGRYTNSDALPCRETLTLEVGQRSTGFVLDAAGQNALSRSDFAELLARAERAEDGSMAGDANDALVARYLEGRRLNRSDRQAAKVSILNESADLFDRTDRDNDGSVSAREARMGPD
jgi:hypothetical protein